MSKLPRISGKKAIKVFGKQGFSEERTSGSHAILKRDEHPFALSVPLHKELDTGLLRGLIKDAGMTVEEFCALL